MRPIHRYHFHFMTPSLVRYVALSLLLGIGLSACSSMNDTSLRLVNSVTPYKIDIVQGNFVSREQAQALKEGMSRNQVRDILGTSLLSSVFHADRWDYVFTFKRQGAASQSRRVTVFFKGDTVARVEADALPSEAEFVASLDSGRQSRTVPVLEMSEESLKATQLAPKLATPKPPPAAATEYPPLEAPASTVVQ
jgi:outer membrane protein assembly factor BamE